MAQGDLTEEQRKYAAACLAAAAKWPKRNLSAEQMRAQVERNHKMVEEMRKKEENKEK